MMSQCVGVGAWVITADKKIVLVENADWKGEQACKIDRPGGHAEPDESSKLFQKTRSSMRTSATSWYGGSCLNVSRKR